MKNIQRTALCVLLSIGFSTAFGATTPTNSTTVSPAVKVVAAPPNTSSTAVVSTPSTPSNSGSNTSVKAVAKSVTTNTTTTKIPAKISAAPSKNSSHVKVDHPSIAKQVSANTGIGSKLTKTKSS